MGSMLEQEPTREEGVVAATARREEGVVADAELSPFGRERLQLFGGGLGGGRISQSMGAGRRRNATFDSPQFSVGNFPNGTHPIVTAYQDSIIFGGAKSGHDREKVDLNAAQRAELIDLKFRLKKKMKATLRAKLKKMIAKIKKRRLRRDMWFLKRGHFNLLNAKMQDAGAIAKIRGSAYEFTDRRRTFDAMEQVGNWRVILGNNILSDVVVRGALIFVLSP